MGYRSTLAGAYRRMESRGVDSLLISELRDGGQIVGVLTRENVERTYRVPWLLCRARHSPPCSR